MELISRQAAIDELIKMLGYCFQADEEVLDAVVTTINELPPAEPKRGRWISADAIFGGVPFYCSECGENTRDTVMGKPRWNFCPNCGADMRGEQNG